MNRVDKQHLVEALRTELADKDLLVVTSIYRVKPQDLGLKGALKLTRDL